MKKVMWISVILFIISIILIVISNATYTMIIGLDTNKESLQIGEEQILTVMLNENIIAGNFEIEYDSTVFELIGSGTASLNVAEKNGKIAGIYADISGNGTKQLDIKFKAIGIADSSSFKINNTKFRTVSSENSYTDSDIDGIDNVLKISVVGQTPTNGGNSTTQNVIKDTSSDSDDTFAPNKLPNTGKYTGYVLLITSIILMISALVFGKKARELDKIFSSISIFVITVLVTTSLGKVYATTTNVEIRYNSELLNSNKTIGIMTNDNNTLTKAELMSMDENISDITNQNGNTILNTDIIKTGFKVIINNEEYIVLLYGDANKDGIIGDTDDLMVIINDYLGKEEAINETRLTANLANGDNVLDTDDLMKMIDVHLGRLQCNLVDALPESTISFDPISPTIPNNDITLLISDINNGANKSSTNIKLTTQSNYEIYYYFDIPNTSSTYGDITSMNDFQARTWEKYERTITLVLPNDIITTTNKMKYKLYDRANNVYSEEKEVTISSLFDETSINLASDILKAGDYVDYPVAYTNVDTYYSPGTEYGAVPTDTGWRVAYNDNGLIKIITGGVPERIFLDENAAQKINSSANYTKYLNNTFGQSVIGGLSYEELNKYKIDWLEANNSDGQVLQVLIDSSVDSVGDSYLDYYYTGDASSNYVMGAGIGIEVGIRPVVTLKSNILIDGGDGTKQNPYKLKVE